MDKFINENYMDYQSQLSREKLINIKKYESLNYEQDAAICRQIKKLDDILLHNYRDLNTVWNNPIFMNKNILFPIYTEIESYRFLNRFNLVNPPNRNIKYTVIIPENMNNYERVINELLTNKKLIIDIDKDYQNKIIANIFSLGWNPEIEISPETKNICREKFGYKLTDEINESCYFIDCTYLISSFHSSYNESNIHPYYIITSTDDNHSIYSVLKDDFNNINQILGDYTGNVNLYLFFAEDMDVESNNWRSEEYDIIDKSYPTYRYYIENLMVARIVKSIESKNPKINLPMIIKLVGKDINPRDREYLSNIEQFANYCILTDNSDIILNYQSHIISPSAYITACINTIPEV